MFLVARVNKETVGFLKLRIEPRTDIPNSEEWLGSWIIVDKPYRKFGIGEKLLEESFEFLLERKKSSNKKIFYIGDVHKDNIASRTLLKKFGFIEEPGKSDDFLLIRKEILDSEQKNPSVSS